MPMVSSIYRRKTLHFTLRFFDRVFRVFLFCFECSFHSSCFKCMSLRSSSCGLHFSAQSFNGPSTHPGVAFKFINRLSRKNIFIKTLILVKIAPHIVCNRRQDRNIIIIFLNSRDSLLPKTTLQLYLTTTFVRPFCIFGAE